MRRRSDTTPISFNRIPAEAIESFAGVGHYFDLAHLEQGECVIDLGSGSGTDLFCAAAHIGPAGRAIGIDMTPAQLAKSRRLADEHGFGEMRSSRAASKPCRWRTGSPTAWSPTA